MNGAGRFDVLRARARRVVHDMFATAALYRSHTGGPHVPMNVRFHTKIAQPYGDLSGEGYAEVITNIERVVFDRDALAAASVEPERGDEVLITSTGVTLLLDTKDPDSGPVVEAWSVTRR